MILRLKLYQFFLKITTYLVAVLAFYLGWWMWTVLCTTLGRPVLYFTFGHVNQLIFATFVWAFAAEHYKVTNFDELFRERTGARAASSACVVTFFVLLAILYFSRNEVFPRALLIVDTVAAFVITLLLHAFWRVLCRHQGNMVKLPKLLVLGADEFARDAAKRLQRLKFAPCEIAAFVKLPGQNVQVEDHRVYDLEQLNSLDTDQEIDEAVIAIEAAQFALMPTLIKTLERLCLPVRAVVDLGEGVVVRQKLFQLGNVQMLDLTCTPAESLDYALLKRIFDVGFSASVLVLTAPLIGLIALLIRLTSSGPIFFAQERVGLNGTPFRMYKFRTLREGE